MREIGSDGSAIVNLVYYVRTEEIFALKIPHNDGDQYNQLIERERSNYLKNQGPYIVKYF